MLVEEEESVQDTTIEAPTAGASMPGRRKLSNVVINMRI